jgi:hypothetical protein
MKKRRNPGPQILVSQREILPCGYIERDSSSSGVSKKTAGFA